jgi:tRNA nucleotidyltransferase/poly(A) polymerase
MQFNDIQSNYIHLLFSALGEGSDLHVVGGAVRDLFIPGKESKDLDFATVLRPEEVMDRLQKAGITALPIGIRRGTVAAVIGKEVLEITTFRNPAKEDQYTSSILEDLPARDFTINSIAYSVKDQEFIDPFGGIADLHDGILRAVSDPRRRFTIQSGKAHDFSRGMKASG